MSIEIRSGGLVAVDTEALRDAAFRYAAERAELEEVRGMLRTEAARLADLVDPTGDGAPGRVELIAARVDTAAFAAGDLARRLHQLVGVYEIVEVRVTRAAADAAGDEAAVARLDARLQALGEEYPSAPLLADAAQWTWRLRIAHPIAGAASMCVSPMARPMFSLLFASGLAIGGAGAPASTAPLSGPAAAVAVRQVGSVRSGAAPESMSAAVGRIPSGDGAGRVRVERYTMADGARRFAVYVTGTRSSSISGGDDPWDMESNDQLYRGRRSASYDATTAALRAAGAEPGDALYVFGHSQGGMIAGRVALEGGFDSRLLVTAGSPTETDVGAGTLSVQLRHIDDPIVALAVGGAMTPVGAPGSIVVERVADPILGFQHLELAPHHLEAYVETAGELDASPDPRAAGADDVLGELRAAASVEVMEYGARRKGR